MFEKDWQMLESMYRDTAENMIVSSRNVRQHRIVFPSLGLMYYPLLITIKIINLLRKVDELIFVLIMKWVLKSKEGEWFFDEHENA